MSGGWLLDPVTRTPLPAYPDRTPEIEYRARHWGPGWRWGIEREDGVPVRMWYRQCQDDCCAEYRANLPPLEQLRRCKCHPFDERRKCGYVEPESR